MTSEAMGNYPVVKVDLSDQVGPPPSFFHEIDKLRNNYRYVWNASAQGYWVLTRFGDIREAFQTPDVFSNHSIVAVDPDPEYRFLPSYTDPPEHMKYRAPLNRWFAPKAVEGFRPELRRIARQIIEGLVETGSADFTNTFGDQMPARSFAHVMGLPVSDTPFFIDCANRISGSVSSIGGRGGAVGAMHDVKVYFAELLADRRKQPRDPTVDFVTHLMDATIDGRPIDDEEFLDICMTLTFGSLDTTKTVLGWSLWHLATHPDDRRWVVEDPSLIPSAVEEFLRAYPIVSMARKVTRDVDFHGCPMKKDDMVLLAIQAATRDPEVFTDPQEVRLDRSPNRHIAFGASEHRCLGSHLARAELQVSLEEWHRRIPDYRIADDEELLAHSSRLDSLPLVWEP